MSTPKDGALAVVTLITGRDVRVTSGHMALKEAVQDARARNGLMTVHRGRIRGAPPRPIHINPYHVVCIEEAL